MALQSPPICQSVQPVPAGKRPPRGHQGGGLREPLRPAERPARQRSGRQSAATEEWRPGRRRATPRRQMVGYGQSAAEEGPSRRSLWNSTNLRAGELSEALHTQPSLFGGCGLPSQLLDSSTASCLSATKVSDRSRKPTELSMS